MAPDRRNRAATAESRRGKLAPRAVVPAAVSLADFHHVLEVDRCQGLFDDLWLDRTSVLALKGPATGRLEVQIWVPGEREGMTEGSVMIAWSAEDLSHHITAVPGSLVTIQLQQLPASGALLLWIGTSFCQVLFDVGEQRYGRRVAVKLHAISHYNPD
jgi:hypothetical protein